MDYILAPSILAADFTKLGEEIRLTEENGAAWLHFDVMDGMFVPSISFGMPVLKSIRHATGQFMDAHLMVQDPIRYVEAFKEAGDGRSDRPPGGLPGREGCPGQDPYVRHEGGTFHLPGDAGGGGGEVPGRCGDDPHHVRPPRLRGTEIHPWIFGKDTGCAGDGTGKGKGPEHPGGRGRVPDQCEGGAGRGSQCDRRRLRCL